jgi:hypothetical protein
LKILKEVDDQTFNQLLALLNEADTPDPPSEQQQASTDTTSTIECRPYPGRRQQPSPAQTLLGSDNSIWFPVVASIYSLEGAKNHAQIVDDKIEKIDKDSELKANIYEARDAAGRKVWAVTLGENLPQEEARNRVCEAQTKFKLANDAYVWASNRWGKNLRK